MLNLFSILDFLFRFMFELKKRKKEPPLSSLTETESLFTLKIRKVGGKGRKEKDEAQIATFLFLPERIQTHPQCYLPSSLHIFVLASGSKHPSLLNPPQKKHISHEMFCKEAHCFETSVAPLNIFIHD